MAQLNDDVLHVIFDHLDASLTYKERGFTSRAICLASRQLLPFGQTLLYKSVMTAGPKSLNESPPLTGRSPGAIMRAISLNGELGDVVEEWHHIEGLGSRVEDDILNIEKLDRLCPRLRHLAIIVGSWSEGGGENDSSQLRRQIRALTKPSCTLARRLSRLEVDVVHSLEVPTIKLGKLLKAASQLQALYVGGFALGGFPRSATGPPCLTFLHLPNCDVRSFLPLIEATPSLERLWLSLQQDLDPLAHGVEALDSPRLGVVELRLMSTVQRGGILGDPTTTYQNINAFIACFPNLTSLRLELTGHRRETTGVDLDKVPRCLTDAVFGFDDESIVTWDPEDTAGPTASELEAWIKRGGAPRLQKLNIGRRATLEGVEGLQKLCDERGVVLDYELD